MAAIKGIQQAETRPGTCDVQTCDLFRPTFRHNAMITPEADRKNGLIFIAHNGLLYFAAPVVYVGVVQAALADKLGASATVANLPASTYLLGALAPLILSFVLPHRLVRFTSVLAYLVTATLLGVVCILLFSPVSDTVRLAAVIGQGLIQGFSAYTSQVYTFQCLKRGHCHVNRVGPQRPALDSLSGGRTRTFPYIECVFSKSFECESIA